MSQTIAEHGWAGDPLQELVGLGEPLHPEHHPGVLQAQVGPGGRAQGGTRGSWHKGRVEESLQLSSQPGECLLGASRSPWSTECCSTTTTSRTAEKWGADGAGVTRRRRR